MSQLLYMFCSCCVAISMAMAIPKEDHSMAKKTLPRIFITGIIIESNTFSPALTNEEAFHTKYIHLYFPSIKTCKTLVCLQDWFPGL